MTHEENKQYLHGVEYPCSPERLIDVALGNRAPQKYLELLRSLPQTEFATSDEIDDVLARTTPRTR